MYRRTKTFRIVMLAAVTLFATSAVLTAYGSVAGNSCLEQQLHIPSLEYELSHGYPRNESGETYGLTYGDVMLESPNLELVENADGVIGYIKASEVPGAQITTPEEAVAYMNSRKGDGYYMNMYLQDGKTVVGQFWVGSAK